MAEITPASSTYDASTLRGSTTYGAPTSVWARKATVESKDEGGAAGTTEATEVRISALDAPDWLDEQVRVTFDGEEYGVAKLRKIGPPGETYEYRLEVSQ